MHKRALFSAAAGATLLLALAGCGSAEETTDTGTTTTTSTSAGSPALTVTDPWVKAAKAGMTAAFGTLANAGGEDVVVDSVTSDLSETIELHETVMDDDGSMAMQPKQGGFVVPAGGEHVLEPGGDHIMVMALTRGLQPGEVVTLTLHLGDGSTLDVEATVKNFSGAEEEYHDGGSMDDMGSDEESESP